MRAVGYGAFTLAGLGLFAGALFFNPFPKFNPLPPQYRAQAYLRRAETVEPPATPPSATLEFVGDVMMARNVEQYIETYGQGYPFAKVGNLLMGNDLLIGNFEGTVREKQHIEVVGDMLFDTTPDNVNILAAQGFDLLSLSNNHTDDFGRVTTQFTRDTIQSKGITPFGDAWDSGSFVAHKTVNGIPFAFIGYDSFGESSDGIVAAIKAEKAAGNFVIVFAHWGVEYQHDPSSSQVAAAHEFVDAGADAIIGAHPHVVETIETYKNVPIIYSLGNFLFDQDWSTDTEHGLAVKMTVTKDKLDFNFIPVFLKGRQMQAAPEPLRTQILNQLGEPTGTLEIVR